MKKIITGLLLVSSLASFAQENTFEMPEFTNRVFVEGNLQMNTATLKFSNQWDDDDNESTQFNFSPKIGYTISDVLSVGAQLKFTHSETDNVGGKLVQNTLLVGPFLRYSPFQFGKRFKAYFDVAGSFGSHNIVGNSDRDISLSELSFSAGINYFVSEHIAINGHLGNVMDYSRIVEEEGPSKITRSNYNINLNNFTNIFNNTSFGVTYFF